MTLVKRALAIEFTGAVAARRAEMDKSAEEPARGSSQTTKNPRRPSRAERRNAARDEGTIGRWKKRQRTRRGRHGTETVGDF